MSGDPNLIWLVPLEEEMIETGASAEESPCKEQKTTIYEPRREASVETNPDDTLISEFCPAELWEN